MALSSTRYFSKGRVALGGATAALFNKFDQSTTPQYNVGFEVTEADGSKYRYAQFQATPNRGVLVAGDVSETSVADKDNAIVASASSAVTSDGTVGSKFIQITIASVTAGQFVGGKFITTDDTGEGYTYDIANNTATDNPVTGDIRLELVQPLQVAVGTTTDFSICANPYHDLVIATTTDAVVVGVTCATIGAAGNYGWIQTKGTCGVLQDATVPAIGAPVELSLATAGAVTACATAGTVATLLLRPIVGICYDPGDSTGHSAIKLTIE
jgi:hypothetical protein